MSKFKIGEKVKIRTDLEIYKEYGQITFIEPMEFFKGKAVTIFSILPTTPAVYTFEEDSFKFNFSEDMIEKEENKS